MSLLNKSKVGVIWNSVELLAQRGMTAVTTIVLAYFLTPEDFGLLAMIAIFIAIGTSLMESGFRQALIRKVKVTSIDLSTAFYCNVALGVISYSLLFLMAPFISGFYEEPRITSLIQVASIAIVIQSLQVVQIARMSRNLDFKTQLKASLPANFISALIAISMAIWLDAGVWSLIIQIITACSIQTFLLYRYEYWLPKFEFSSRSLKEMYSFGYKIFLAGLLDTVFKNIYVAVIAKIFAVSVAGHYFFANKIKQIIVTQVVKSIQTVTFPALSSIQSNEERLKLAYKRIIRLSTYLLYPVLMYLIVTAELIFSVFLPESWLPAVPFLQIMCIAGLMYPLHSINLNILKVKGRSDLFLYIEIFKKIIITIGLLISIQYGIYGILIGQVIVSFISYIPNGYFSSKLIGYKFSEQLIDVVPNLLLSLLVAALTYSLVFFMALNNWIVLFVVTTAFAIMYWLFSLLFKMKSYEDAVKVILSK